MSDELFRIGRTSEGGAWHLLRTPQENEGLLTDDRSNWLMPHCSASWEIKQITLGDPTCMRCKKTLRQRRNLMQCKFVIGKTMSGFPIYCNRWVSLDLLRCSEHREITLPLEGALQGGVC